MDIAEIANEIHLNNKEKGFWNRERNIGELLMLVTSELSEALEADRNNKFADWDNFNKCEKIRREDCKDSNRNEEFKKVHFQKFIKDSFEDEIADAIIRLFDLCAGFDIPIEKHIRIRLQQNS